jgi:hypothetical protein
VVVADPDALHAQAVAARGCDGNVRSSGTHRPAIPAA